MSLNQNDGRQFKKDLNDMVREVSAWRDRLQTVLGLVHAAETDGERAMAASLARKLQDRMMGAAKHVQTFSRRLGELAEQLEKQAVAASNSQHQPRKE
jgi:GTPase involved in cell partitioning and DNA repair